MQQVIKGISGLAIGYLLLVAHQFYGFDVLVGCVVTYPIQLMGLVLLVIAAWVGYRHRSGKQHHNIN